MAGVYNLILKVIMDKDLFLKELTYHVYRLQSALDSNLRMLHTYKNTTSLGKQSIVDGVINNKHLDVEFFKHLFKS